MKRTILAAALAALSAPAIAQQGVPVNDLPRDIEAVIDPHGIIDGVQSWELDFTYDGVPDRVVQAVVVPEGGGNAFYLMHFLFQGMENGRFAVIRVPTLDGGIDAVSFDGEAVLLTVNFLQDGDARCCPTGIKTVKVKPF